MRNRQVIGYTLGPLERNEGDDYLIRGGGGWKILFGLIIFGMGSAGKFIFIWHGLGKIYFRVNMVNHSPLSKLQETVMLLKAVVGGNTKINHPLISSDSVYYFLFYGIIPLSLKKENEKPASN